MYHYTVLSMTIHCVLPHSPLYGCTLCITTQPTPLLYTIYTQTAHSMDVHCVLLHSPLHISPLCIITQSTSCFPLCINLALSMVLHCVLPLHAYIVYHHTVLSMIIHCVSPHIPLHDYIVYHHTTLSMPTLCITT